MPKGGGREDEGRKRGRKEEKRKGREDEKTNVQIPVKVIAPCSTI